MPPGFQPFTGLVSAAVVNHRDAAFVNDLPDHSQSGGLNPEASPWKRFFQRWLISTLAVLVAVYVVDGIDYQKWPDLLVASLLLGVLNTFLRPLLMLLSLPLVLLTFGLYLLVMMLVVNALILWLAGSLLSPHFTVDGFWSAFWGALVISTVSLVLNAMTGTGNAKMEIRRGRRGQRPSPEDRGGGSGPVIDV